VTGDQSTSGTERCIWCEEQVDELVESDIGASGFLISGPDGEVLTMTYGDVCPECWDSIRDQWERTGDLTKPLSAFGGGSA